MNDRERMKFYLARKIWPWRDELTPSSSAPRAKDPITWAKWFVRKHGETLGAYRERARREGIAQQVIDHELAEFGWSRLQRIGGAIDGN